MCFSVFLSLIDCEETYVGKASQVLFGSLRYGEGTTIHSLDGMGDCCAETNERKTLDIEMAGQQDFAIPIRTSPFQTRLSAL